MDFYGCFNSMGWSVDTLLIHLKIMEDMWILSAYLNAVLLKYDGEITFSIFDVIYIYIMLNSENTIKTIATTLS